MRKHYRSEICSTVPNREESQRSSPMEFFERNSKLCLCKWSSKRHESNIVRRFVAGGTNAAVSSFDALAQVQ